MLKALTALVLTSMLFCQHALAYNELLLGSDSRVSDYVDIPVNPVSELDYKSKAEILQTRSRLAERECKLLKYRYQPSDVVFGQIVSSKPWWGIAGGAIFGSGDKSILGDSEESRFINNPLLLVGASPWSNEIWDQNKLSEKELSDSEFPFLWLPSIIRIFPAKKIMQIAYDVSRFNKKLKDYDRFLADREPIDEFGLVAYNARDFGYNYLYVPIEESKNIINTKGVKTPVKIEQYIHLGNSSGYPGGCNNMSPAQDELDHFQLKDLPARVKIKLWKSNPGTPSKDADMTVFIELR